MKEEPEISCAGGCGLKATEQRAEQLGWARLPITGRSRCGKCTRELEEAGRGNNERVNAINANDTGAG